MRALAHADMILHLEENLPTDDRPDDWVYTVPWELEKHLERVRQKRNSGSDDTPSPADEDYDTPDFSRSELVPDTWKP